MKIRSRTGFKRRTLCKVLIEVVLAEAVGCEEHMEASIDIKTMEAEDLFSRAYVLINGVLT